MPVEIAAANRRALDRLTRARPAWTAVRTAREALGLEGRSLLHAGPPIDRERMCGPMRGGVLAAILHEGWARSPAEAAELAASAEVRYESCHARGAVGPMAGIISPGMPVLVVEDRANGTVACATLNEGPSPAARFGAHGPETVERLRWLRDVLAPALARVVEREGPVELTPLMAQALAMGDEMHMRNTAASALLVRLLAAPLAGAVPDRARLQAILGFLARGNDQLFLNFAMAAAKAAARAVDGLAGSTVVSTMARNGVEFGIRVAGLGDRWFTGPASTVDGVFLPGFGPEDATPDIGDSAIMETYGLGAFAMAAAPAVLGVVGPKSFADALGTTRHMAEICLGTNPAFPVPALDGDGTPAGIDLRRVVQTGIVPVMNTAIAHRDPEVGRMVGA
ncbi:MAG: DUF1116 domain-containing protein, partial [Candidatus Rokuibacteriota bacterium]